MSRSSLGLLLAGVAICAAARAEDAPLGDPMRPYAPPTAAGAAEQARPFVLSGVLISSERRVAVINGALYREGETVDGAQVLSIARGSVRLQRGTRELVVELERRPPARGITDGETAQ